MSTALAVGIGVVVVLFLLLLVANSRRRDTRRAVGELSRETVRRDRSEEEAAPVLGGFGRAGGVPGREVERAAALERRRPVITPASAPPAPAPVITDPETLGVTRRQFLNRGITAVFGLGLGGFGASMLAFLWPQLSGGFGSKIKAGKLDDILGSIRDKKEPYYVAEGRFYINPYPKDAVPKAKAIAAYGAVVPGYTDGV